MFIRLSEKLIYCKRLYKRSNIGMATNRSQTREN